MVVGGNLFYANNLYVIAEYGPNCDDPEYFILEYFQN